MSSESWGDFMFGYLNCFYLEGGKKQSRVKTAVNKVAAIPYISEEMGF